MVSLWAQSPARCDATWGHLHKGHLFFRLGLAKLSEDVAEAKTYIQEALAEDRLVAQSLAESVPLDVEALVHRFPSYVTLCMLERLEAGYSASDEERREFFQGLVSLRFDVIWDRKEVEPSLVRHAIGVVVPQQGQEQALIQQANLGRLLRAAIDGEIFPTDAVRSTCQMIHILKNELHHTGEKAYEYEVTSDIAFLIGLALKILLDSALVEWAERVSESQGT